MTQSARFIFAGDQTRFANRRDSFSVREDFFPGDLSNSYLMSSISIPLWQRLIVPRNSRRIFLRFKNSRERTSYFRVRRACVFRKDGKREEGSVRFPVSSSEDIGYGGCTV